MSEKKKPHKRKDYYMKDGKKVSKKVTHSETYNNETYKYVKEGGNLRAAGKGDADRTGNRESFRENYEDIFKK